MDIKSLPSYYLDGKIRLFFQKNAKNPLFQAKIDDKTPTFTEK